MKQHEEDLSSDNSPGSYKLSGGRRRRASHRRDRRSKHHRRSARRSHHRRSKRRGTRRRGRGRRGGGALAQMVVPFGLIALQQVIGERANQQKLRSIDRSMGNPGTSVIKGAVNVGTGVVRTGLGVVQSVMPGRKGARTRRRTGKAARKSKRRRR